MNYYFGCHKETGHYLWEPGMTGVSAASRGKFYLKAGTPFPIDVLDGGFIPDGGWQQGRAWINHFGDWTVLAFADNSVDTRGGSHSTFVLEGRLEYDSALALARINFPEVFARFRFDIVPAEPRPSPKPKLNAAGRPQCPANPNPNVTECEECALAETPKCPFYGQK